MRPRHTRSSIYADARLRVQGLARAITLFNVSPGGFRAEGLGLMSAGQHGTLKLDGYEPIGTTVVWAEGETIGCRFDRPLHPAVVDAIARRFPSWAA